MKEGSRGHGKSENVVGPGRVDEAGQKGVVASEGRNMEPQDRKLLSPLLAAWRSMCRIWEWVRMRRETIETKITDAIK